MSRVIYNTRLFTSRQTVSLQSKVMLLRYEIIHNQCKWHNWALIESEYEHAKILCTPKRTKIDIDELLMEIVHE